MSSASQFTQFVRYRAQAAGCPSANISKKNPFTFFAVPANIAYCGILLNFLPNLPSDGGGGGCGNFSANTILDGGDPYSNSSCVLYGGDTQNSSGQILVGGSP